MRGLLGATVLVVIVFVFVCEVFLVAFQMGKSSVSASHPPLFQPPTQSALTPISGDVRYGEQSEEDKDPAATPELVDWLAQRKLGHLQVSLEALGAYHPRDLFGLDSRDRRRLWMEASLGAAALGEDVNKAVAHWEKAMSQVESATKRASTDK